MTETDTRYSELITPFPEAGSPQDRVKFTISKPEKAYMLAVQQTFGSLGMREMGKTDLNDDLLAYAQTFLGFGDDVLSRTHDGIGELSLETRLFISGKRQKDDDCAYYSTDRIGKIKHLLEEQGRVVTYQLRNPEKAGTDQKHQTLIVADHDVAVQVDFGFNSQNDEAAYFTQLAINAKNNGNDLEATGYLQKIREDLSNGVIMLKYIKNIRFEDGQEPLANPDLSDIGTFRQQLQNYGSLVSDIVTSLYIESGMPPPETTFQLTNSMSETKNETKDNLTSVYLVPAEAVEKYPTFSQIGGQPAAIEALQEFVFGIKHRDKLRERGGEKDKGTLLVGGPGNGKSLMVEATAKEAGVPFFLVSYSDFARKYMGEPEQRVKELFSDLKKFTDQGQQVLIGFEEVDALAANRDSEQRSSAQLLNTLLEHLDGPRANPDVSFIATSNREDMIDPAWKRAGRTDKLIHVNNPDKSGRYDILVIHMNRARSLSHTPNEVFMEDIDMKRIAELTEGYSGSDLANLQKQIILRKVAAEVKGQPWTPITVEDFEEQITRLKKVVSRPGFGEPSASGVVYSR